MEVHHLVDRDFANQAISFNTIDYRPHSIVKKLAVISRYFAWFVLHIETKKMHARGILSSTILFTNKDQVRYSTRKRKIDGRND